MGSPSLWRGDSRVKVKIMVSDDMERLEARVAVFQVRGLRKVGEGVVGVVGAFEGMGSERAALAAEESVPMWWVGIIALAVSESGQEISRKWVPERGFWEFTHGWP